MNSSVYLKKVKRYLLCNKGKKDEIIKQLESDISIALDNGETFEDIYKRLGDPKSLAKEFNTNMGLKKKNPAIKIIVITVLILGVFVGMYKYYQWYQTPKYYDIETSNIFNQEDIEELSKKIINLISEEKYDEIANDHSDYKIKEALSYNDFSEVIAYFSDDLGEVKEFGNAYYTVCKEGSNEYVITEFVAIYEDTTITYRLSFNRELELSGIYLR